MNTQTRFERIGHRGAPRQFLENTMASFREAVRLGADAVELDVHVSSDGVPVVHHDPNLPRNVTPPTLRHAKIANLSSGELSTVRFAGGDELPILADLLAALATSVFIYVELKGGSSERVAAVLHPHASSIAVHSFDHDAIVELAAIAPDIRRGVLLERWPADFATLMKKTGATDIWPAANLVDSGLMAVAGAVGGRVIPWTVNTTAEAKRLVALGVAGVCTDDLTIFDQT
jgi:glycerophosphoryl diester phosphodiesterase